MAKAKAGVTQSQRRELISKLAKLKKLGLVSKHKDLRSQQVTRHMRDKVKKFADVLKGSAQVVKAPSRKAAAEYKDNFRVLADRIVVPAQPGTKAGFSKRKGGLYATGETAGRKFKIKYQKRKAYKELPPLKAKEFYAVPFKQGGGGFYYFRTNDKDRLLAFMGGYERKPGNYSDWIKYLEIHEMIGGNDDDDEDGDADGEDFSDRETRAPKKPHKPAKRSKKSGARKGRGK